MLCGKVFYLIVLPFVRRQHFHLWSFFCLTAFFSSLLFTVSVIYFFSFDVFHSVISFDLILWVHFYFGFIAQC